MAENNGVDYTDYGPLTEHNVAMIKDLIANEKYIDAASWVSKWLKEKKYGKPTRGALSLWSEQIGLSVGTMKTLVNASDQLSKETDARLDRSIGALTKDSEVADARGSHTVLSKREDAQDKATEEVKKAHDDLSQNVMRINESSNLNKLSLQAVQARSIGSNYVAQAGQIDQQTGLLYVNEQTDTPGTQTINEYDLKTHQLKRSRSLGITETVWLQGNSLFHDPNNNALCFILPKGHSGVWGVYNFDTDNWDKEFKLDGTYTYCIDAEQTSFITLQNPYDNRDYETPLGFNVYDLDSVIAGNPQFKNFIPVKNSFIKSNNKIQGFIMVNGNIYIGRGAASNLEWFRTTALNGAGAIIGDYHWDFEQIIADVIQPEITDHTILNLESEGMSYNYINGEYVPVLVMLAIGVDANNKQTVDYVLLNASDPDGIVVPSTVGLSAAQFTKVDDLGIYPGMSVNVGGAGSADVLTVFQKIKQIGLYNFSATVGNGGLDSFMASCAGVVNVKEVNNGVATKIAVTAIDYNGVNWTNYYDPNGPTGPNSSQTGWVGWSADSSKIIDARDAALKFDPLKANGGTYVTQSKANSPTSAETKVYEIKVHAQLQYRIIRCFDFKEKQEYRRMIASTTDSGWQTLANK